MKILAIETSCDETGISVLEHIGSDIYIRGNALSSQIELHAQYGGVFPAMAKRAHVEKILPLLVEAFTQADISVPGTSILSEDKKQAIRDICTRDTVLADLLIEFFEQYAKPELDYISATSGPGLEPALWVGVNTAKCLSAIWNIPLIPINHMEGHIVSAAVARALDPIEGAEDIFFNVSEPFRVKHKKNTSATDTFTFTDLQFPALALLVSGGHTELVLVEDMGVYKKIGQTRDDAVGEAFDKVARMLGLAYPGGPKVSKLAKEFRVSGAAQDFILPRPMMHTPDFDFSFSGIKTAMLYTIRDLVSPARFAKASARRERDGGGLTDQNNRELTEDEKSALAAAFEDAVIEVLIKKTMRARSEYHIQSLIVGGGVAGNTYLKSQLTEKLASKHIALYFPEAWLATDNAVMIGLAALTQIQANTQKIPPLDTIKADGNLSL
jgi:N6-L-threonylcarbamoyladenine synthase